MRYSLFRQGLLSLAVTAGGLRAEDEADPGREGRFRDPQDPPRAVSHLAETVPFAYYPSLNRLEVALRVTDELRRQAVGEGPLPATATVQITPMTGGGPVATGTVALTPTGLVQAGIDLPDLADGEYQVVTVIGKARISSAKSFRRVHFPFEKNELGLEHTVYPPFQEVQVSGRSVTVVGRTYQLNGFGLPVSVVSLGRELLAGPAVLVCESGGTRAVWEDEAIAGERLYPDLARFTGRARCAACRVTAQTEIEEDGCAVVTLSLAAGTVPGTAVDRLWLEIPVKAGEAPLFHVVGDNSMRHNYAGKTPAGGRIVWDLQSQPRTPVVWRAESGPENGVIWDANQVKHRGDWSFGEKARDQRPFVPYLWLGAEARGLAWFGESDKGYVVDHTTPVQSVVRDGERIVIRVALVQRPTVLKEARTLRFGFQASPTKPLDPAWRTRPYCSGAGPVVCWGGYLCSSKYPDSYDWSIVDKIQEIRRTGVNDPEWFERKDKERRHQDWLIHNKNPWIKYQLGFAGSAAGSKGAPGFTYFEEHVTDRRLPEWEVFQDEWASIEFPRFEAAMRFGNWGVTPRSYHDFALFFANEWMERGVSVYFDNAYPKRNYNLNFSEAYRDERGQTRWAITLLAQRRYYKRIWKLAQAHNLAGSEWPIDVIHHLTNTLVLPMHTWTTVTMDGEQAYRTDEAGRQLPWPPDYTRTVTLARTVGSLPTHLYCLRGHRAGEAYQTGDARDVVSEWGMNAVHEIRSFKRYPQAVKELVGRFYLPAWEQFGYGQPGVTVHNYWEDTPFVQVDRDEVKWIVLTRTVQPAGLLVLQSYAPTPLTVRVRYPAAAGMQEIESGAEFAADAEGGVTVEMPGNFGTRLLQVRTR